MHVSMTPDNLTSAKKIEQSVIKNVVQNSEEECESISSGTDENVKIDGRDPLETLKNGIARNADGSEYYLA